MHERLKFKIQLNDERGKNPDWGYQPIFSESQYGSHFVVNARVESSLSKAGTVNLKNIHFHIQNYSGEVTVGLEKFSLIEECNKEEKIYKDLLEPDHPDSKIYKITLFARGFNNNFAHTHTIRETLKEVNPGDILVTEVLYLPVTKRLTNWDNEEMLNEALYVDPVYMERDGEDVELTTNGKSMILKMNQVGMSESDHGEFDFSSVTSFDVTGGVGGTRRCKASVSMMI